jgi:pimeloyl-ACP methyl ester carboxylesterase
MSRITLTSDDASSCRQERTPCLTVVDLYLLAKAGFVVIASDYRFHGATAKRDEWGGVDVNDLLNLVPALRSIDFVDWTRLYMLGVSRGGTMTYLALKRGAPVRAAAVIAGPSDLEGMGRSRPEFVNGDETYDGWAKVWPDYASRAAEYYRERSAVQWADKLTVPILIWLLPCGPRNAPTPSMCTPMTAIPCRRTGPIATGRLSNGSCRRSEVVKRNGGQSESKELQAG